jgi:hypothetical protein
MMSIVQNRKPGDLHRAFVLFGNCGMSTLIVQLKALDAIVVDLAHVNRAGIVQGDTEGHPPVAWFKPVLP